MYNLDECEFTLLENGIVEKSIPIRSGMLAIVSKDIVHCVEDESVVGCVILESDFHAPFVYRSFHFVNIFLGKYRVSSFHAVNY
jgi:hypothetical protein